ncbi:MAG: acylphosphatase [Oscillospiraceae bacterium]|nr:acylphosphatase [Oscillospiraceae bacterium]
MTVRKRIIFSGSVQGVGFRWHAKHTAQALGVTGWVENCYDGSVEMEAEGDERAVDALILAMQEHTWANVDDVKVQTITPKRDYYFEIR